MATLSELASKEASLPKTADVASILELADEVIAYGIAKNSQEVTTQILVNLAKRIYPSTKENYMFAVKILKLAEAGEFASRKARERDDAYQEAYEKVRQAISSGMTETDAAKITGFDRMTIRKAVGKGRKKEVLTSIGGELDLDYLADEQDSDFDLILAESGGARF